MKFSATVTLTAFLGTAIANPVKRDVEERQLNRVLTLVDPLKNVANANALGFTLPPIPIFSGANALSLPLPPNQAVPAAQAFTKSILTAATNLGTGIPNSNFALTGLQGLPLPGVESITSNIAPGGIDALKTQLLTLALLNSFGNYSLFLNNLGPAAIPLPIIGNILPGITGNQILDIQKLTNGALTNVNPLTKVGGILDTLGNLGGQNTGGLANLAGLQGVIDVVLGLLQNITNLLQTVFGIIAQITGGLPGGAGGIGILG